MKKTSHILALLLAVAMLFTLCACGKPEAAPPAAEPAAAEPAAEEPAAEAPAEEPAEEPAETGADYGEYSAEKPLELKLSHFAASETNQLHLLAAAFKEKVEAATSGAVAVTIYTGGVLGNDRESFESVISGTIQMAVNNTPIISNYYEQFQILDLGYLFNDYDHINAFLNSDICQELKNGLAAATGARMLCMQAVGYRNFDMCTSSVHSPADIAGLKVRVTDSPIYMADYEAWGANPTIIAGPEVLTALQQGTIDGCDNTNNVQYADGYYEFAEYITVSEHAVHFNGLTFNEELFQSLTPDLQAAITAAAVEAAAERTEKLRVENEAQLTLMSDAGATVTYMTDEEKQVFKDALADLYADFEANHAAGKLLAPIQALAD